jgi:hypothetical protein
MSASAANPINYQDIDQQVSAADARAAALPTQQLEPYQLDFINEILPDVLAQSARTGIPPEVFITQSSVETDWGRNTGWWGTDHNPAGVGVTGAPGVGFTYPNISAGFASYADHLMGIGESGQGQFVSDVKAHASTETLLNDLEASPWAGGHYGGTGLNQRYESLYGNASNNATTGTGQADTTTDSTSSSDSSGGLGSVLGNLPIVGGLFKAATAPVALAGQVLGLFQNWRYVVEVLAGLAMMGLGIILILHDTGVDKKVGQAATTTAVVAAA